MSLPRKWIDGAVFYQIYPRSFYDTNNDGVGDLQGIIQKLDYLVGKEDSLGVDAIWLSPFYRSPMYDFGYDVSDHCDVDPIFGTLSDFDELIKEVHKRKARLIIDLIPNHTSYLHPWFMESKSNLNNPKRDWYIWKDAKDDGSPPNNWLSAFNGSAWELDKETGQYYLHSFLKEQPDLNWDNPEVRQAMKTIMKFWLDRGVDGFRVDAVYWIDKDNNFLDDPVNPNFNKYVDDPYNMLLHINSNNGPNLYKYLRELSEFAATYKEAVLITEAYPEKIPHNDEYIKFYQGVDPKILSPFNFEMISLPWKVKNIKSSIDDYQSKMKTNYTPIYVLGNHDNNRLISRMGIKSAKQAAVLLLTLPGSSFIYYGDEIGMDSVKISKNETKDKKDTSHKTRSKGRDPERSPMQWESIKYAGFSNVRPWLPVSESYVTKNVSNEVKDKSSSLNFYKELIELRHKFPSLSLGKYSPVDTSNSKLYAFFREDSSEKIVVILNFSHFWEVKLDKAFNGDVLFSTSHKSRYLNRIEPYGARIIKVS